MKIDMTKILIFEKKNKIYAFQVKGHTGYAEEGNDIVCSAISTATQMALLGLEEVLKLNVKSEIKDGFMYVSLEDFDNVSAQSILQTMKKTLENIAKEYAKFVKLEVKKDVY